MSGLFIKKDETITVEVHVAQGKDGKTVFSAKADELEAKGIKKEDIKKEVISFRMSTYSDSV